jgi:stage II sporulation protein R
MARKFTLGVMLIWTGLVLISAGLLLNTGRPAMASVSAELSGIGPDPRTLADQVIRLHVVANSDSDGDQALKRAVRDAILAEVTPLFLDVTTPAEARATMEQAIPQILAAARRAIAAEGKGYSVQAEFGRFDFPGKAYGSLFLPAGQYTALRVLIGEAKGANWWCVLFPPMCFVDWSTGVVLEPVKETGGKVTVPVQRKAAAGPIVRRPIAVDEETLAKTPVRARFAIVDWLEEHLGRRR